MAEKAVTMAAAAATAATVAVAAATATAEWCDAGGEQWGSLLSW